MTNEEDTRTGPISRAEALRVVEKLAGPISRAEALRLAHRIIGRVEEERVRTAELEAQQGV